MKVSTSSPKCLGDSLPHRTSRPKKGKKKPGGKAVEGKRHKEWRGRECYYLTGKRGIGAKSEVSYGKKSGTP